MSSSFCGISFIVSDIPIFFAVLFWRPLDLSFFSVGLLMLFINVPVDSSTFSINLSFTVFSTISMDWSSLNFSSLNLDISNPSSDLLKISSIGSVLSKLSIDLFESSFDTLGLTSTLLSISSEILVLSAIYTISFLQRFSFAFFTISSFSFDWSFELLVHDWVSLFFFSSLLKSFLFVLVEVTCGFCVSFSEFFIISWTLVTTKELFPLDLSERSAISVLLSDKSFFWHNFSLS